LNDATAPNPHAMNIFGPQLSSYWTLIGLSFEDDSLYFLLEEERGRGVLVW
jgi:hypothetical protein